MPTATETPQPKIYTGRRKEAIACRGGVGGQVVLHGWRQRAREIGLGGQGHEAAGPQQVDNFHHPGVHRAAKQGAARLERG